ncbi:MAG TPA: Uma2 family endonuclease [Tepidisphaeraceae bacterium]|nr:Uma2 family endonuclease [Tepidisphaeraceae bacterium]
MTISTQQRMTAAEFLALPPDNVRSELVRGEVVVMSPSPSYDHGYAIIRLAYLLVGYAAAEKLGQLYSDLDCYFGPDDVRRPDLLYFAPDRLHLLAGDQKPHAPPDLCVEVLSPSNPGYDRTEKFDTYQAAGVPHYWIVDPMERTLEAYKLVDDVYVRSGHGTGNDVVHLPPFDGLAIPLATLWRPRA